jgi:hypothetical protein
MTQNPTMFLLLGTHADVHKGRLLSRKNMPYALCRTNFVSTVAVRQKDGYYATRQELRGHHFFGTWTGSWVLFYIGSDNTKRGSVHNFVLLPMFPDFNLQEYSHWPGWTFLGACSPHYMLVELELQVFCKCMDAWEHQYHSQKHHCHIDIAMESINGASMEDPLLPTREEE